jgi:predicted ArsR family transcriptional regulator
MEPDAPEAPLASPPAGLDERLARLGVLQEPLRRALYLYVAAEGDEVSRDQAAEALGIRRSLAAFHLDKLAGAGLLEVGFRRLTGRSGPGAGRPAKLYRRSSEGHQVSLPPREYELAAHLLATAIEQAGEGPVAEAVQRVGRGYGEALAQEQRRQLGPRPGRRRQRSAIEDLLSRHGFEPYDHEGELRLRNCPFHSLARDHTQLACGMNLALIDGLVAGLEGAGVRARLDPGRDGCCVVLDPVARRGRPREDGT